MLHFELELLNPGGGPIHGLARGHMTVSGGQGRATSRGKQPDQSMMIFVSAVELLDGIRRFVADRKTPAYNFVGADSSFQLWANRIGNDRIRLTGAAGAIEELPAADLIAAVWDGVGAFLGEHLSALTPADPVADDLRAAVTSFREAFHLPA